MKRINNIYQLISAPGNLALADKKARKNKLKQPGVIAFDKDREANLTALQNMLQTKTYKTSPYTTFTIFEPKERLIYRLPYFPDRLAHHAAMNVLEKVFVSTFTADTYSCIKGRGIHAALRNLQSALQNKKATAYCLKMDIRKFYPTVDHAILKNLLRKKFKDQDLLTFLDEIIDSAPGLPIGNYLSQYLANFYLTYFDHWLKETKGVKYYYRYADDIVILSDNKPQLHQWLSDIRNYLQVELKLEVKPNYQVFPVAKRGIDFVGYVVYPSHTRLRKSIKQSYARMMIRNRNKQSQASYQGWLQHANCKNLNKKLNELV